MGRIARVVAPGVPHHVTQRGNNRAEVFFRDKDRNTYLRTLVRYCDEYKLRILAYCLMPNHIHLLAVPERENSLAQGVGRTNLIYTQYVNREFDRCGRLWQNRFFSCPIDQEAYLWAAVRYIETNPVRAHLVQEPWAYRWSSARHHVLQEPDLLIGESQWLAQTQRRDYRQFLTQDLPELAYDGIRAATATGRPLGTSGFIDQLELKLGRLLRPEKAGRRRRTCAHGEE